MGKHAIEQCLPGLSCAPGPATPSTKMADPDADGMAPMVETLLLGLLNEDELEAVL